MSQEGDSTPVLRRIKPVVARELPAGSAELIAGTSSAVDTIEISPAIQEAARSPEAPVVDPTRYGRRQRRKHHARQYRLAQVAIATSMLATIGSIMCLLLGDRRVAWGLSGAAAALAVAALALSNRTRLALRVHGYAVAALLLSGIAVACALLLPKHALEESAGDAANVRVEKVAPRGPVN